MNEDRKAALARAQALIDEARQLLHEIANAERAAHGEEDEVAELLEEAADELSELGQKIGEALEDKLP
jgi:hypothetical protein